MTRPSGLAWSLLTTFGLGHMRPASGTWGSMPTVVIAGGMLALGVSPQSTAYNGVLAIILVVFSAACVHYGDRAEARYGKDPSEVVADETAGQCIPLMFLPVASVHGPRNALFALLYAFVAFRVMDIIKPPPARELQRIPAGWGILLDDLFAGVYAAIVVQILLRVLH